MKSNSGRRLNQESYSGERYYVSIERVAINTYHISIFTYTVLYLYIKIYALHTRTYIYIYI